MAALQSSRADALARMKTSFHAASAFLLAASMVGCSGPLDEADVAGANLEEGQAQGALEIRRGSGDDAAPGAETIFPPLPCAPLCQGSCTPVDLATGIMTEGAIRLALTDQYVFYGGGYGSELSDDEVGRIPKAGGAKTILIDQLTSVSELVGSGADAYFVTSEFGLGSHLNRVNPNGTITAVPTIGGYPMGVAVDSTHIYWIGNDQYHIYAMPLSGGTPTVVVPHAPSPAGGLRVGLYMDGDTLYHKENSPLNSIMQTPKSGGAAPTRFLQGGSIWSLAFDQTHVYYVYGGWIQRMPKSGGTPVKVTLGGISVAVDNERLYWLDGSALRAMCKDGTGAQVLATINDEYGSLAVDSTGVYWTDDGKIRKIAK